MEYATIAGTDIRVSRIGLGTWAIGGWMWGGTDEEQSVRTIQQAVDHGITLIDTAPIYGKGRSEELVGKALEGRRDEVAIATKCGLEWDDDDSVRRNSSPERIRDEVEASLRRLRTDYIDLYQVHWPDPHVSFRETAETLEALQREGKIRAIGVSNYAPEQMDAFRRGATLNTCQPPYNLFERAVEQDVLPYCRNHGITTLTYGALCRGLLSGKMSADRQFAQGDLRGGADPKFQAPRFAQYVEAAHALDAFARQHWGRSVLALAVRWLLDQPGVGLALWGARRPEQLAAVEDVMGWHVDEQAKARIDALISEHVQDPAGPEFMAPPL
jgi:aryl-alcohol dehydrogenase-like predicted oxidoreductase